MIVLSASDFSRTTLHQSHTRRVATTIEYDLIDLLEVQSNALDAHRLLTPKAIDGAGRVLGNRAGDRNLDSFFLADEAGVIWSSESATSARAVAHGWSGAIVGRAIADGHSRACIWQDDSPAMLPLPDVLADEVVNSFAGSASADGQIAGWMTLTDGSAAPWLWVDGNITVLPAIGELTHGYPASILDDGSVAGEARGADGGHYPIAWRGGNATLLDAPRQYGRVLAGSATCGAYLGSAWDGNQYVAAIWCEGRCEVLPSATEPFCESAALALNTAGVSVGVTYVDVGRNSWLASRWQGGVAEALDDLIDPDLEVRIISANAINGAGQIAAAAIWPDGSLHAVRLDPR